MGIRCGTVCWPEQSWQSLWQLWQAEREGAGNSVRVCRTARWQDATGRWRPFFEFLAQTGLRIGEAIEVRWSDIDFGTKTLRVSRRFYRGRVGTPKSKYGRRPIRLSPAMAQRLWQRWADERPADDDLVWTSELGKRVDQSNLVSRVLKPAARTSGVGDWVGFHTFRHTCATMLFRHGWNAVQVQQWLGHHKPSFTLDTYVHLLPEDLPDGAFLDEIVGNSVGDGRTPSAAEIESRPVTVIEPSSAACEPIHVGPPRALTAR
jgi:integrase